MKYGRLSEHKYYLSIDDLSIYLWNKIHETGDLSFLLVLRKPIGMFEKKRLTKVWQELKDQHLKHFGLNEMFEKKFKLQAEIIELNKKYVVDDDKSQLTFIDLKEIELQDLNERIGKLSGDFWQTKAQLEKYMSIPIDLHKTSVKEYFSYFKVIPTSQDGK